MKRADLIQKLKMRVDEERLAYRVARENRDYDATYAGKADGFSEVLELLGEPYDTLAGKPWLW